MQGQEREAIVLLWRGSGNTAGVSKSARPQDEVRKIIITRPRVQTVTTQNRLKIIVTILIISLSAFLSAVFMKYSD